MLGTIESQKLQDMVLCRQVSLRRNGYGLYEAQWLVAELVLLAMYEMVLMNARMCMEMCREASQIKFQSVF